MASEHLETLRTGVSSLDVQLLGRDGTVTECSHNREAANSEDYQSVITTICILHGHDQTITTVVENDFRLANKFLDLWHQSCHQNSAFITNHSAITVAVPTITYFP